MTCEPGRCVEALLSGWGWRRAQVLEVGFIDGLAVCRVVFADGVASIKRLDQLRPYVPLTGLFAGMDEE